MTKEEYLKFLKCLLPKMESLERSTSVVIQGPLHPRMKKSIPHYLKIINKRRHHLELTDTYVGNLVISYWEGDDESIIKGVKNHPLVKCIKNKYSNLPKHEKKIGSRGASPWIYQNYSTLQGLKECTGHISLKVRSDEFYGGIEFMMNEIVKDTSKFYTTDIFFRKDHEEKFHISDHIIGGATCKMKRAFEISTFACQSTYEKEVRFPEQLICRSILKSAGEDPSKYWNSKEMMKKHFCIFPIKKLGEVCWTCSYRGYGEIKLPEAGWVQDIREI
jgi:hypothetical protein